MYTRKKGFLVGDGVLSSYMCMIIMRFYSRMALLLAWQTEYFINMAEAFILAKMVSFYQGHTHFVLVSVDNILLIICYVGMGTQFPFMELVK